MANTKTQLATDIDAGKLPDPYSVLGRLKVGLRTTIALASQASGDTIELGDLPQGFLPLAVMLHSSVSLGSATAAIGISGSAGKYRAAATFTAADAPSLFGVAANIAKLTAKERLILTVGTAALPASGTLIVAVIGLFGD